MALADQPVILAPNLGAGQPLLETEKRPDLLLLFGHYLLSFKAEQEL